MPAPLLKKFNISVKSEVHLSKTCLKFVETNYFKVEITEF